MRRGGAGVSSRQCRPGAGQVDCEIEVLLQSRTLRLGQMTTAFYFFFQYFLWEIWKGCFLFLVLGAGDCVIVPSGHDCGFCFLAMRVPLYIH